MREARGDRLALVLALVGVIALGATAGLLAWSASGPQQRASKPEQPTNSSAQPAIAPRRVDPPGLLARRAAIDEPIQTSNSEPTPEHATAAAVTPDVAATFDALALRIRDASGDERKAAIREATRLALELPPELMPEAMARLSATADPPDDPKGPPGEPLRP